jgi:hypothetical protein
MLGRGRDYRACGTQKDDVYGTRDPMGAGHIVILPPQAWTVIELIDRAAASLDCGTGLVPDHSHQWLAAMNCCARLAWRIFRWDIADRRGTVSACNT